MALTCKNCGEKLDERSNYCLICGEPVQHEKVKDQEDYAWSMSLKEIIDQEFDDANNPNSLYVESKYDALKQKKKTKIKEEITKKEEKKKKPKKYVASIVTLLLLVAIIGGAVAWYMDVLPVDAVMTLFKTNVEPEIHLYKGINEAGMPEGEPIKIYGLNTKTFTVYGQLKETPSTPIYLCWKDISTNTHLYDQVVYVGVNGDFHGVINVEELGYTVGGVTQPGDYLLTVSKNTYAEEEKAQTIAEIEFQVQDKNYEKGDVSFVQSMYMTDITEEGVHKQVEGYEASTDHMQLGIAYANVEANTELIDEWFFEKNGEWKELSFEEQQDYWTINSDGQTPNQIIEVAPLTPVEPWKAGNYRVELYTKEQKLAGATQFYISDDAAVKSATNRNPLTVTNIYVTNEKNGENTSTSINADSQVFLYYTLENTKDETTITWLLVNNETGAEIASETISQNKDGKYEIALSNANNQNALIAGEYAFVIYEGDQRSINQQLRSFVFTMVQPKELSQQEVEENGTKIDYTDEKWFEWNEWLCNFVDNRMPEMHVGEEVDEKRLIDFATLYYYYTEKMRETMFPDEDTMIDTLDSFGMMWLTRDHINTTLDWLLQADKIDTEESTDFVSCDGEDFAIKEEEIQKLPMRFAQVTSAYDCGNNYYVLNFNVYEVNPNFNGDINGTEEQWKDANTMPALLGEMTAHYEIVTNPELDPNDRPVLRAYYWLNKTYE